MEADDRHLPQAAAIDAYGKGGFRFAGLSHRGSILCLPDGIWAWPVTDPKGLTEDAFKLAFARGEGIDISLVGTGRDPWPIPALLREQFRALNVSVDAMPTSAAVRTYNILMAENRRVGAGLIAVD